MRKIMGSGDERLRGLSLQPDVSHHPSMQTCLGKWISRLIFMNFSYKALKHHYSGFRAIVAWVVEEERRAKTKKPKKLWLPNFDNVSH